VNITYLVDAVVEHHGTVTLLRAYSPAARSWIDEHVDYEGWQVMGNAIAVEPRMLGPIVEGMQGDGLIVREAA